MKNLVIKFNGSMEDLETILEYVGLNSDTYDRVLLNATRFVDTKFPCFITVSSDMPQGFVLRISEKIEESAKVRCINAEEILADLKAEKRKMSIMDLQNKCTYYMGYCDLCPYNKACQKILEVYKTCK
jgi:hypothetical protein